MAIPSIFFLRACVHLQELLTPEPGNAFAANPNHDLEHWNASTHKTDMADALAQALYYSYRKIGNVLTGIVAPVQPAAPALPTPLVQLSKKRKAETPPKSAEAKAALEKLLTKLEIEHWNTVKGQATQAEKLHAAHAKDPDMTRNFLRLLDKLNRRGIGVSSKQELAHRLTHLRELH